MSRKVVVIGHGYLSRLALVRSLGRMGCDVTVIVTMYGSVVATKPLDCYSKYVNQVFYCNAKDEKGLITILKEHCVYDSQKVVIIPDSDFSAAFVDKHREDLVENFVFPHIKGPLHIEELMDKERQKILAREIGIKTPNTTVLHIRSGVIPDLEKINYPCFTKALTTMGGVENNVLDVVHSICT